MSVLVATSPVHMHAHTSSNDRAFDINTLDSPKRQKPIRSHNHVLLG